MSGIISENFEGEEEYPMKCSVINGIVYPPIIKEEDLNRRLNELKIKDDDIFIATYPKTGTTLTAYLTYLIVNGNLPEGKKLGEVNPWIERYDIVDDENDSSGEENNNKNNNKAKRRVLKTHLNYELAPKGNENCKYIYVVRNIKDTLVSMYHFNKSLTFFEYEGDINHFFELFRRGKVEYGLYLDHLKSWFQQRNNKQILFLSFEDISSDKIKAINDIANFLSTEITEERINEIIEKTSFNDMKTNPATNRSTTPFKPNSTKFFRKGIVGDYINHLSEEQIQLLDQQFDETLGDLFENEPFWLNLK
eukprot:TRINITY_DN13027_c0_g1_i1.p2 TRINITY_DN13027_c0_g1~~TRINITY_DN13027_c0_g1_i1.p2  ORF type:complete len:307 (-),score=100.03 TRINITY_DN13027_c0_g1_i1:61-981(-)